MGWGPGQRIGGQAFRVPLLLLGNQLLPLCDLTHRHQDQALLVPLRQQQHRALGQSWVAGACGTLGLSLQPGALRWVINRAHLIPHSQFWCPDSHKLHHSHAWPLTGKQEVENVLLQKLQEDVFGVPAMRFILLALPFQLEFGGSLGFSIFNLSSQPLLPLLLFLQQPGGPSSQRRLIPVLWLLVSFSCAYCSSASRSFSFFSH